MKSTFLICFVVFAVIVSAIVGFTTSDNPTKINSPKGLKGIQPEIVYGPSLDDPTSTLNESFEGTTFPPAGWIKQSTFSNTGWTRQTAGTTPLPGWTGTASITTPVGGGNACAYVTYGDVGVSNNEWLITPQITNVQPGDSLTFWLRYIVPTYADSFEVKISTTTQTIAAMNISVFKKRFSGVTDTGYIKYGFVIGALVPPGSNIYIGFREMVLDNLNDGSAFTLDLVHVGGAPPPPTCSFLWSSQTSGTTNALLTVSAVSDQIGWAAGNGPTVRRTTDGGTSWTNATGTGINGNVYNIYAWSANDALCTTSPGGTFIYKTTNGGTSWTQVHSNSASTAFINCIQMVSPTEGYAQGDPVNNVWEFLKTTDAGSTWTQMASAPPAASDAGWNNSMYILGNDIWWNTNVSTVYHSSNLGLNWSSAPIAPVTSTTYGSVHFNSSSVGLASGSAGIVKTTNGGASYTSLGTIPGAGNITALEGDGANNFWFARGTEIYLSTNGGTNFTSSYNTPGSFNDIDFTIVNGCPQGWGVTASGGIHKMRNATGITPTSLTVPDNYSLGQNFPNPFNPTTNINFSIPRSGLVTLKIYDMAGKEVVTLVNEVKTAGSYIVGFNAANLASGAYFYRVTSGEFVDTKKMLLVK